MDGLLHGLAQNKSAGSIVVDTLIKGTIGAATSYGLGVLGKLATGAASKLALTGVGKTLTSVSNSTTFKLATSTFDKVNSSFIGKNIVESSVETLISTSSALVKDEKLSFDKLATNFISNLVTNSIFNSIDISKNTRVKEDAVEGGLETCIVAKNGIKIKWFASHGVDRAIGDGMKRACIKPESILDARKNPLKINDIVMDQFGRRSQRFIGDTAEVVINPLTVKIVSINPTSSRKAAKLFKEFEAKKWLLN